MMRRAAAIVIILICAAAAQTPAGEIAPADRRSGYDFMSRETQAMQDDDTANPGTFSVLDGETLWNRKAGSAERACSDCHGDAGTSMKGVATRYPAFTPARGRPINLDQRINLCRTDHQKAPPLPFESKDLLALATYLGRQSRGLAIEVTDERLKPFIAAGQEIFMRRQGQLNLSCAQCHDDNWGRRLAGSVIPQGHPNGYPLYRLEWQAMGSLQRRLRNCLIGMRAEAYDYGSAEFVDLELYLMWRARGMKIETPAVRP